MNCLKTHNIERLANQPGQASPEETEHLFHCEKCRTLYLEYASFKKLYSLSQCSGLPTRLKRAIWRQQPSIIEFTALKTNRALAAPPYRLAAQGGQPIDNYTVFSFSNEKEEIVARVMHDQAGGDVLVYIIAQDPDKIKHRKVKLLPTMLEGITDDNGYVNLGKMKNFTCSDFQINLPLASFKLSPHIDRDTKSGPRFTLVNNFHDEITINIEQAKDITNYLLTIKKIKGDTAKKELQVAAFTDKNRAICKLTTDHITVFETEKPEKVLSIHIY